MEEIEVDEVDWGGGYPETYTEDHSKESQTSWLYNCPHYGRLCLWASLHSSLTLLDPFRGAEVWDMNEMSVIFIIIILCLVKKWSLNL